MKKNELLVLKQLNGHLPKNKPVINTSRYHRFDAYNENYIVEVKYRNKEYENYIIEFDKYAYNVMYSDLYKKKFLYVVGTPNDVYVFNITNLIILSYASIIFFITFSTSSINFNSTCTKYFAYKSN